MCSCGSVVEHCVSSAKVVGSTPRKHTYWQYKCIAWMHCKSLWIKASAKCIHVNVVLPPKTMLWFIYMILRMLWLSFCSYRPPIDSRLLLSTLTHPAVIYMTACVSKVFCWQLQTIRKHILWQTTCFRARLYPLWKGSRVFTLRIQVRNFPELRKRLVCHSCLASSKCTETWSLAI